MFILKNNFHNTEVQTRGGTLSLRTVKTIKNKLCGVKGCQCSGELGIRGPQEENIIINEIYLSNNRITFRISTKE